MKLEPFEGGKKMARTKKEVVEETPVVDTTVEETAEKTTAKKTTKRTAKKTAEEKETAAKKTTKKAAAEKDTTVKKTTTRRKKAVVNTEVFVQFMGKEVITSELIENIKNAWAAENEKTVEEITDLKVYVKPEENKAYYVVNGEMTSTYEL